MSFGSGEGPAVRSPQIRRPEAKDTPAPSMASAQHTPDSAATAAAPVPASPAAAPASNSGPPQTRSAPIPVPQAASATTNGADFVYVLGYPPQMSPGSPGMVMASPPGGAAVPPHMQMPMMQAPFHNPPTGDADLPRKTITRRIPNEHVGRVIGKMGSTIREIQENSGASIYMPKEGSGPDDAREVQITGTDRQVAHCDILIRMKISPGDIDELTKEAREHEITLVTRRVEVPIEHVGRVIGKRGATIRMLQETTGAHVDLPKESAPGETSRIVTISGSEEAVMRCVDLLRERITPRDEGGMAGPGGPPTVASEPGLHVFVPNDLVGNIIGRKGARIKELQEISGAKIFLPKECIPGTDVRNLVISGPDQAQKKCAQMLEETMQFAKMQMAYMVPGYGMSPPVSGMQYYPPYAAGAYYVPQYAAYGPPDMRSVAAFPPAAYMAQFAPPPPPPAAATMAQWGAGAQPHLQYSPTSGGAAAAAASPATMRTRPADRLSLDVPNDMVAALSAKLSELALSSGAQLEFAQKPNTQDKMIMITGDRSQIGSAQRLVTDFLSAPASAADTPSTTTSTPSAQDQSIAA